MNAARWRVIHWIMDLAIICEALLLANLAKWVLPFGLAPAPGTNFITPLILAMFLISWSILGRVTGLYYSRQPSTLMLDLQRAVATLVLTLVVVASLLLFFKYTFFSRLLLLYFFAISLLLLAAARLVLWKTWNLWRTHAKGTRRVLIIGNGEYGRRLSQALKENP